MHIEVVYFDTSKVRMLKDYVRVIFFFDSEY